MAEKVLLQRIVTLRELADVFCHEGKRLYKHNSSRRNTSLTKPGTIAVDIMFWGQYDAVTYNKDTGDTHLLIILEVPKSRIKEKGRGVYFEYEYRSQVFCEEYIIAGYRPDDIKAVYNLKGKSFHEVYSDLQFGRIEHIKLEKVDLARLRGSESTIRNSDGT